MKKSSKLKGYTVELSWPEIEHGPDGLPIRMDTKQHNRAKRFIRDTCCDYDTVTGNCLSLGCQCVQCNSQTVLCKQFRGLIKELDKPFDTELFGGKAPKMCPECKHLFVAANGHIKYCPACAELVRRRKKTAVMRKARAKALETKK